MRKLVYLVVSGFLLVYCNENRDENGADFIVADFPKEISLSSEELEISSVLLKISRIEVIDSFFVVYQKRSDTIFSIFQLPDLKHLYSFGKKGNGPYEFNLAFATTFKSVHGSESAFAMGNKMNNVQYYKVNDLLNNNSTPYKIAKLPPKLNGFRAITYLGDSLIFGAPYGTNDMDLFKYNTNDKLLEMFIEYPDDYPYMDNDAKRRLYGCYMAVKPDNTEFARTYANMGKIELYYANDNDPFVISYKNFPPLRENLKLSKSSKVQNSNGEEKIFSWGIRANNRYIYVQVFDEVYTKVAGSGGPLQSFVPQIHVFDWKGNPIAKLQLDSNFIVFDIDSEGKYLYTSSVFEDNIIRRYYLSALDRK